MDEAEQARQIGATILSVPAPYANKIYSTVTPTGMRITFVEHNIATEAGVARSAVFMGYDDIEALIALLQRQLALVEKVPIGEAASKE